MKLSRPVLACLFLAFALAYLAASILLKGRLS